MYARDEEPVELANGKRRERARERCFTKSRRLNERRAEAASQQPAVSVQYNGMCDHVAAARRPSEGTSIFLGPAVRFGRNAPVLGCLGCLGP